MGTSTASKLAVLSPSFHFHLHLPLRSHSYLSVLFLDDRPITTDKSINLTASFYALNPPSAHCHVPPSSSLPEKVKFPSISVPVQSSIRPILSGTSSKEGGDGGLGCEVGGERGSARRSGDDVAQLVEHRTGTLPTPVRCGKGFFSQSHSVQTLLRCLHTPMCNRMH